MDRSCLETGSTETFARSVNAAALAEPSSWSGSSPALATIDVLPVMEKGPRIQGNTLAPSPPCGPPLLSPRIG